MQYWLLRWRRGATAKECGWSLEATVGKEMDSPLQHPEGTEPYQHCDFSPGRPRSDF